MSLRHKHLRYCYSLNIYAADKAKQLDGSSLTSQYYVLATRY